jgi:branched-chain amino acid transport system substrate-binding protein
VSDKKSFTAALKAADFQSLRGNFRFNNNHFPIQDFYAFEVVKESGERYGYKVLSKALSNHQDAFHSQCAMK